ncbi:hypothetical protein ACWDHW_13305 [Streptomyces melanosporofaciens]
MTDTSPTDQIRVDDLARLLSAADVHINHGDYPTWDTLGESGQGEYRKAARYLLARCRITPRTTRTGSDQQPRETGQTAPHGPHGPSGAPVAPATPERAAGGRTAVRKRLEHARDAAALHRQGLLSTAELYAVIEADPAEPTTWVDGDPLMEATADAIWEHCRTEGTSLVVDDPRNIAAVAAHVARTTPDSPADSQDNQQDSTDTPPGHDPLTSADTVRTRQDTPPMDPVHILGIGAPAADEDEPDDALREQYAAAVNHALLPTTPGRDRRQVMAEHAAVGVLAVRDRRMEQLAAEVEELRARAEQAEDLLRVAHDTSNRSEAERAAAVERAAQAGAAIARVRDLADQIDLGAVWYACSQNTTARIRDALADQLAGPHPAEAERDQAYAERAALLAWISALHPANAVITTAPDVDEPGWQLLYLLVSGWQMSWHIHPRDAQLFAHVEHVPADDPRAQWDGHSTAQKYERIQENVNRLGEQRASTSTVRIEITPDPPHVADAIRDIRRFDGPPPRHP